MNLRHAARCPVAGEVRPPRVLPRREASESGAPAFLFVAVCVLLAGGGLEAQSNGIRPTGSIRITSPSPSLRVADSALLTPSSQLTIEAWFYFDSFATTGNSSPTILRKPSGFPTYLLRASNPNGGNLEFYLQSQNGLTIINSGSVSTPLNSWNHVAGTYDGQTVRLYLNGILVGSAPRTGLLEFEPGALEIGSGAPSQEAWKGSIDSIRLWHIARTGTQIAESRSLRITDAPGLVAAWYFDGDTADSVGSLDAVLGAGAVIESTGAPVYAAILRAPPVSSVGERLEFLGLTIIPNAPYLFDVSLGGTQPGIPLGAPLLGSIPLNPPYWNFNFGTMLPPEWFGEFLGFTDAQGMARPYLEVPDVAALVGANLSAALILLDPLSPLVIDVVTPATTTLLVGEPPTVTGVTPAFVPTSGNTQILVTGTNFLSGAGVTVGSTPAVNVQVLSSTQIQCQAPPLASGPYSVTVTNPGPVPSTTSATLTYVPPLVVTNVQPAAAIAGTPITIFGSGFTASTELRLDGVPFPILTRTSGTIVFICPTSANCNTQISLFEPATALAVSRIWNATPSITTINGGTGPSAGGTSFTIIGSGFPYGTTVTVGGAPAGLTAASTSTLSCVAPPGVPGSSPIVVSTPSGCFVTGLFLYF